MHYNKFTASEIIAYNLQLWKCADLFQFEYTKYFRNAILGLLSSSLSLIFIYLLQVQI